MKYTATLGVTLDADNREAAGNWAELAAQTILPDHGVLGVSVEIVEQPPYRGALEICQEIVAAENTLHELKRELFRLTGKDHDEFIAGMRRLMAPADDDTIGMIPPKV